MGINETIKEEEKREEKMAALFLFPFERVFFFFRFFFFVPVKNKTKQKKTFLHGAAATVVRDLKTTGVVVQITLGANQV